MTAADAGGRPRLPRVGFDTETHLSRRGRVVPRMVCLSLAWRGAAPVRSLDVVSHEQGDRIARRAPGGGTSVALLTGARAVAVYRDLLGEALAGRLDLVAQNATYDLAAMAEAAATRAGSAGPLLVETLDALDAGAVRCTLIREKLIAIGLDRLRGAPRGYFSLGEPAGLVQRYLGGDRSAEKGAATACEVCGGTGFAVDARIGGAVVDRPCATCDGFGEVGPWRLRYAQLDGVPLDAWPAEAVDYALQDAVDALDVCDAQDRAPATEIGPLVDDAGHVVDEVPQLATSFAFALLAAHGVCVDPDRTATLDEVVSKIAAEAAEVGTRAGFVRDARGIAAADPSGKRGRPGTRNTAALHALVTSAYGGPDLVPRNDPTETEKARALAEGREPVGSVKADRDTLLSSGVPDLVAYAEVGSTLTLARTYVPILREGVALGPVPGGDGTSGRRVHGPITSRPNVLVATGRASWGGPNWTNPPRDGGFRECVVPRPGCTFVACDYGAAELRAFGQICLWEGFGRNIVDAFVDGRDLHADFAADVLGIPYAEAIARIAAGDEEAKGQRQIAKVGNYGFLGGMSGTRFVVHARNQNTPLHNDREKALEIAWFMHGAFRQKWPESVPYFAWVGSRTGSVDDPRTFTARQYVSGRLRGGCGYTNGCNTYFQGLIADGAKAATWRAVRATHGLDNGAPGGRARALAGARIVLFLHDELIAEVPCGDGTPAHPLDAAHLTAAAEGLALVMREAMQPYMPDVPVEAEAAAMLRWVKGPKERRGAGGVLLPCDWPDEGVICG